MIDFKGSQFEREIILWGVRWYVAYPISYRQLEEMMQERGVSVDHSTLNRWVIKYAPEFEKQFRRRQQPVGRSWRMDETYVRVKGQWKYLYRAVDKEGHTIDFLLTPNRDRDAAEAFLHKAIRNQGLPEKITIDQSGANTKAIEEYNRDHHTAIIIRHSKYLNNLIEQDHRAVKRLVRPMLGFKSFWAARCTIAGIEVMHAIRKGQLATRERSTKRQRNNSTHWLRNEQQLVRAPSSSPKICDTTGKSLPQEGPAKCLAFVQKYDQKPKRRLYEVLQAQGVQANQSVIFLSDGGETVRGLPEFLIPESEHWLDWFHVTLRLTVMGQMIKGLAEVPERSNLTGSFPTDDEFTRERVSIAALEETRESMKWNVWNGNVTRALERAEELIDDLETWPPDADKVVKLEKAVHEFAGYIALNQASIPNYGDRQRHGERIASSFVEAAVNQVVSKRMVKKQQMRWSERGAHLLLQVRTQVLNGDLRQRFARWYPGMEEGSEPVLLNEAA